MIRDRAVRLARLGVLVVLSVAVAGCDTTVATPAVGPPVARKVERGYPVRPATGCTPGVWQAVEQRDTAAVERLAAARVDFNCSDPTWPLPLDEAVVGGHWNLVRALLDAGADPNARWSQHGDRFPLEEVLDARSRGRMPLYEVVGITRLLLRHGADPNQRWCPFESRNDELHTGCRNETGVTPLMMAAALDLPDVVRLLLDAGADPALEGGGHDTALEYARSDEVENLLLPVPMDFDGPPAAWSEARWAAATRAFQERHPDPNDDMGRFESPLTGAAGRGQMTLVRLLLRAGADPDRRAGRGSGMTALAYAASEGWTRAVDALLAAGADVNLRSCGYVVERDPSWWQGCRTDAGATPVMLAAAQGDVTIVRRLLDAGADARLRDWRGRTARDYAHQSKPRRPELEALVTR